MISAAVGFQCPECVAAGARETRQNELPYGGVRSRQPAMTTYLLIAVNALVWLGITLTGGNSSRWVDLLSLSPRGYCLSSTDPTSWFPDAGAQLCATLSQGWWHPGVSSGAYWQLITSAFTHVEVLHIAMNMLSLWFIGPPLERALGRTHFLTVYLLSALAGSAAVMWWSAPMTQTLGASGAIFGLIGALAVLVFKVHGDVRNVLTWLGINLAFTFLNLGAISWQGHLGGLAGGLATAAIIIYSPKVNRSRVQLLGLAGFGLLVAVLIGVRMLQLA